MIEAESQQKLKREIAERMIADRASLDQLRAKICPCDDLAYQLVPTALN